MLKAKHERRVCVDKFNTINLAEFAMLTFQLSYNNNLKPVGYPYITARKTQNV